MVAVQRKMTGQEKAIVRFILSRMTAVAYSNNMKPVYEKNVDRVMSDIFDVSRFCKKLSRGTRNEAAMINLINSCGLENLWKLCREGPHYNMLVTLVAMDAKMGEFKKEKRKASEAGKTAKVKKINKAIKKYQKVYKQAVRQFRDIFDIKKDTKDRLLEKADNWLDQYDTDDYGGYLFDELDMNGDDSYESMMKFAEKAMHGNRKSRRGKSNRSRVIYGAFNIGGDADDDDDDLDYLGLNDDDDEDEDDEDDLIEEIEALRAENSRLRRLNGYRNASARGKANFAKAYYDAQTAEDLEDDSEDEDDVPDDVPTDNELIMNALSEILRQNKTLNDRMIKMERTIELLDDDDDSEGYEEVDINVPTPDPKRPVTRDVGDGFETDITSREDILREMESTPESRPAAEVTMSGFAAAVRVDKETAETDIDAPVTEDDPAE